MDACGPTAGRPDRRVVAAEEPAADTEERHRRGRLLRVPEDAGADAADRHAAAPCRAPRGTPRDTRGIPRLADHTFPGKQNQSVITLRVCSTKVQLNFLCKKILKIFALFQNSQTILRKKTSHLPNPAFGQGLLNSERPTVFPQTLDRILQWIGLAEKPIIFDFCQLDQTIYL